MYDVEVVPRKAEVLFVKYIDKQTIQCIPWKTMSNKLHKNM